MAPLKDLSFYHDSNEGFMNNINKQTVKTLKWDITKLKDLNAEPDLIESLSTVLKQPSGCVENKKLLFGLAGT